MEAIQQEVAREVNQLLRVVFNGRRQSGHLDLEATEMVVRSVMHQAGVGCVDQIAVLRLPARQPADYPLCLRSPGSVPGTTIQAGPDGGW
jgi:hypothetical protein